MFFLYSIHYSSVSPSTVVSHLTWVSFISEPLHYCKTNLEIFTVLKTVHYELKVLSPSGLNPILRYPPLKSKRSSAVVTADSSYHHSLVFLRARHRISSFKQLSAVAHSSRSYDISRLTVAAHPAFRGINGVELRAHILHFAVLIHVSFSILSFKEDSIQVIDTPTAQGG